MIPQNNFPVSNGKYWLKKGVNFVQNLPWSQWGEIIFSLLKFILTPLYLFVVKLPEKIPWGFVLYISLFGTLLYSIYPSSDSKSGGFDETALAFLIAIAFIVVVVGSIFAINAWRKREKKTEDGKKKEPPKNKPRLAFWIEPSTLMMILFGYVFFTMAYTNGLFDGAIMTVKMPGVAYMTKGAVYMARHPKEGYLYIPYFGLTVSFLLGGFLSLLDRSKIVIRNIMGSLVLPFVFGCLALGSLWLMPFMQPHDVVIGLIPWFSTIVHFPADPQVSKWLIFFAITGLILIAPRLPGIRYYYNVTFIRTLIAVIALIMFGEQMFIYGFII
jgi:hypothetical protein